MNLTSVAYAVLILVSLKFVSEIPKGCLSSGVDARCNLHHNVAIKTVSMFIIQIEIDF